MTDEDKRATAYHEAGHALVAMLTPGADPVHKVTIIPRGMALGVTLTMPDEDRFNLTKEQILAQIKHAMGGRAAEKLVLRLLLHRRRQRPQAGHRRAPGAWSATSA